MLYIWIKYLSRRIGGIFMFKEWLTDIKRLLLNKNMFVVFLLLLVLGFTFGYNFSNILDQKSDYSKIDIENPKQQNTEKANEIHAEEDIAVNSESQEVVTITSDTRVVFEREYLKNEVIDKEITTPQEEIVGLDKEEVEKFYKDWTMISFTGEELILHKAIDSYSPGSYKMGVAEKNNKEYIAVFSFNKAGEEVLEFISEMPISILGSHEQEKFIEGMIFNDIDEVHRMLENYDL